MPNNNLAFPSPQEEPQTPGGEHSAPPAEGAKEALPGEVLTPALPGASTLAGYDDIKWTQGVEPAPEVLQDFKQLAQELNLPAQTAQKLVDWECSRAQALGQTYESQHQQLLQNWAQASKEMLGPQYHEQMELAVRAADKFGGEPLRQLLEETGLGNHPVIVKTFCQIGRATAEDCSLGGKESSLSADKTFAEALYGSN